jgi:hypothetical protein
MAIETVAGLIWAVSPRAIGPSGAAYWSLAAVLSVVTGGSG